MLANSHQSSFAIRNRSYLTPPAQEAANVFAHVGIVFRDQDAAAALKRRRGFGLTETVEQCRIPARLVGKPAQSFLHERVGSQ